MDGRPVGAVRVSFGYMSTKGDAEAFVDLIQQFFVVSKAPPADGGGAAGEGADAATVSQSKAVTLVTMTVYPVKSCAGFKVAEWPLGPHGLAFDREWSVVDSSGTVLNQKREPRLATIVPTVNLAGGYMELTAPSVDGAPAVRIPLQQASTGASSSDGSGPRVVTVCGDTCSAVDVQVRSTDRECALAVGSHIACCAA